MQVFIVSFDFSGITDPDTGAELYNLSAYTQFLSELHFALRGDPLVVGYAILPAEEMEWRINVRFIVPADCTKELLDRHIQKALYADGGLSGHYFMEPSRVYFVEFLVPHETTWVGTSVDDVTRRFLDVHPNAKNIRVRPANEEPA